MKKKVFILAAIAGFAISAIAVSCSKVDPGNAARVENTPQAKPLGIITPHEWWLNEGIPHCVEFITPHVIEFCYFSFESEFDPNNTWGMHVEDRRPLEMVYSDFETVNMTAERRNAYNKFLSKGFIEIKYDCPINDPNLLQLLDTDFIPAGTYPIFLRGNDLVIRFANKN